MKEGLPVTCVDNNECSKDVSPDPVADAHVYKSISTQRSVFCVQL